MLFLLIDKCIFLSDSPVKWQMGFQESAVPTMEGIINFHNHIMIVISFNKFIVWMFDNLPYGCLTVFLWV